MAQVYKRLKFLTQKKRAPNFYSGGTAVLKYVKSTLYLQF